MSRCVRTLDPAASLPARSACSACSSVARRRRRECRQATKRAMVHRFAPGLAPQGLRGCCTAAAACAGLCNCRATPAVQNCTLRHQRAGKVQRGEQGHQPKRDRGPEGGLREQRGAFFHPRRLDRQVQQQEQREGEEGQREDHVSGAAVSLEQVLKGLQAAHHVPGHRRGFRDPGGICPARHRRQAPRPWQPGRPAISCRSGRARCQASWHPFRSARSRRLRPANRSARPSARPALSRRPS